MEACGLERRRQAEPVNEREEEPASPAAALGGLGGYGDSDGASNDTDGWRCYYAGCHNRRDLSSHGSPLMALGALRVVL